MGLHWRFAKTTNPFGRPSYLHLATYPQLVRGPGHRLDQVFVGEATYCLAYNTHGRITTAPGADLTFDVHNHPMIAQVGGITAGYLYDGLGQMVARLDTTGEFERYT